MSTCPQCGGLRMQPGIAYGYAGPICYCRGYYRDMELVYKPSIDRLRDDMAKIQKIAAGHEWPNLDKRDAERYRRLRENWVDCSEIGLHGRTVVIDSVVDLMIKTGTAPETEVQDKSQ